MDEGKDKNKQKTSRRNFLKNGVIFGGSAIVGGSILKHVAGEAGSIKESRAMTPGGHMFEIDPSRLQLQKDELPISKERIRKGVPDRKFVMVIDLSRCKNERNCQKGCKQMHDLEEDVNWLKVYRMQDAETTAPFWMPAPCFHCDNPPCVKVCPVDATFIREDGVVLIDNERCIGCRFCMAACPYSARTFNWSKPRSATEHLDHSESCSVHNVRIMGTVEKCDFCVEELANGQLPKCVTSCPNGVFYMGDLNEDSVSNLSETVRFSDLIESKAGYRYMEDLGTQPSVYYLPPANRLFPFREGAEE